jgi:hypothetical protein
MGKLRRGSVNAEIKRLRAALKKICKGRGYGSHPIAIDIARTALEKNK